jgi:hypothetical protein
MEDRFISSYKPAVLIGRLKDSAGVDAFLDAYEGPPPVRVDVNGASLTLKKLRNYRDSLAPVFHGVVLEREEGSVILGHFSPQPYLFLALVLTLGGVGWAMLPSDAAAKGHAALWITPLSFLFCAASIAVSRWMGRGEKDFLEAYLETCCTEPAPLKVPETAPLAALPEEAKEDAPTSEGPALDSASTPL